MYREWKKVKFPKPYYIYIFGNNNEVREDGRIVVEKGAGYST
jgi:hypothetical protein